MELLVYYDGFIQTHHIYKLNIFLLKLKIKGHLRFAKD